MSPSRNLLPMCACLTVSSILCTIGAVESPDLQSNASGWNWLDSAPFSKRTITISASTSSWELYGGSNPVGYRSDEIRLTPEVYDTEYYISPVDCRYSITSSIRGDNFVEDCFVRSYITGTGEGEYVNTGSLNQPLINVPIANSIRSDRSYTFRFFVVPSVSGFDSSTKITVKLTYDIYYRSAPATTQAPFTLPSDWMQSTTQSYTTPTDIAPQYTTLADISTLDIQDYNIYNDQTFLSRSLDTFAAMGNVVAGIANEIPYFWALVLSLAFGSLIIWLLH